MSACLFVLWKLAAALMRICQFVYRVAWWIEKVSCKLAVWSCGPHYELKNRYYRAAVLKAGKGGRDER